MNQDQALLEVAAAVGIVGRAAESYAKSGVLLDRIKEIDADGKFLHGIDRAALLDDDFASMIEETKIMLRKIDMRVRNFHGIVSTPDLRVDMAKVLNGKMIDDGVIQWMPKGVIEQPKKPVRRIKAGNIGNRTKAVDWHKLARSLFNNGYYTIYGTKAPDIELCCRISPEPNTSFYNVVCADEHNVPHLFTSPLRWAAEFGINTRGQTPWGYLCIKPGGERMSLYRYYQTHLAEK